MRTLITDPDGATAQELSAAVLRLAFQITTAAFEEAMREYGFLPSTIRVVCANARANISQLDEARVDVVEPQPKG